MTFWPLGKGSPAVARWRWSEPGSPGTFRLVMRDERALRLHLLANPSDLTAGLALADCLEEQDGPRGELLRIEHALTQQSGGRGGCWADLAFRCRAAYREIVHCEHSSAGGFRVCFDLDGR